MRHWRGHLTGVQRTVVNVARELARLGPVGFFVHDVAARRLTATAPRLEDGEWQVEPLSRRGRSARALALRVERRRRDWGLPPRWLSEGAPQRRPAPQFADGDIVALLGNVWDQPGLQDAVARARSTHHLRVAHLVHDLIPILAPQWFEPTLPRRYARYVMRALAQSDLLLANSQATANDLTAFAALNALRRPPVTVVRPGDELAPGHARREPGFPPAGTFALSVGNLEARKNPALLYAVWRLGLEQGLDLPRLVLAGGAGWGAGDAVAALRGDPLLRGRVTILSGVSDGGLRWLYENCRFTLFPTLYEGWGLPVAESLQHGRVCLASRSSSVPEIAGDLLEYFSPFDAAECLALIARYLDDDVRARREARIRAEYRPHPWARTAAQIDAALRGAVPVPAPSDGS